MAKEILIRCKRAVPLEDLTMSEVTVMPEYLAVAEDIDEALGEFYWNVPIEDHTHFSIETVELR